MIPFWKKTGKHSKPQSAQKRRQNAKPVVPRTAQQSIPMQRMFEDGTCRVKANYYTRTIQYQDINYQLAQQEDKTAIFEEYHCTHRLCVQKQPHLPDGRYLLRRQLSEHHGIRHQRPAFEGLSGHGFQPDRHHAHPVR